MSIKMAKSVLSGSVAPTFVMTYQRDAVAALDDTMPAPLPGHVMRSMTETLIEIGAKGGLGKRSAKRGRRNSR